MFEKSALRKWFTDADQLKNRLERADDKRMLETEILAMYRRWESLAQRGKVREILLRDEPIGTSIPTGRSDLDDPKTRTKTFSEMMEMVRVCKAEGLPGALAGLVILLIQSFPKTSPSNTEGAGDLGLEMLDERASEDDDEYQPPTP